MLRLIRREVKKPPRFFSASSAAFLRPLGGQKLLTAEFAEKFRRVRGEKPT
jgi:hypothetical protein